MKQLIVNVLFSLGDLVSRSFLCRWEFGGYLYQTLMLKSVRLQDKWKLDKPWGGVE